MGVETNGRQEWGPSYLSVSQVLEAFSGPFWIILESSFCKMEGNALDGLMMVFSGMSSYLHIWFLYLFDWDFMASSLLIL